MTTQQEALRQIIDQAIVSSHEGMLQSDIIAGVLADMPRLMQALGAHHQTRALDSSDSFHFVAIPVPQERWITEWREIDSE